MAVGFDLGSITRIDPSSMMGVLGLILSFLGIIIGAGAVIAIAWYVRTYNIEVLYFDRRSNSNRFLRTWARKIVEDGIPKLKIWAARRKTFEVPDDKFVFQKGKRDCIFMTRNFDGKFKALDIDLLSQDPKMKESPMVSQLWESLTYRKNFERFHKTTFFDKYGIMMVHYGFIAFLIVLLIVLFTKFQVVADSLNAAIKAAGQCQRL